MSQPIDNLPVQWHFSSVYGPLTQPLLLAGDQLLGVAGGTVFALDLYHGQPVRPVGTGKPGYPYRLQEARYGSTPLATAGGRLYLLDADGPAGTTRLLARRLATGQPLPGWTAPAVALNAALLATNDRVVVVHTDSAGATLVAAYDGASGADMLAPTPVSDLSAGLPAAADGAAFLVADDRLHAVNLDFGDVRWRLSIPGASLAVAPCVAGPLVLVGTPEALLAIDQRRGQQVWAVPRSGSMPVEWAAPALDAAGRYVVATNSGGDVMRIELADGHLAWCATATQPGPPSLLAGQVYVPATATDGTAMLATYAAGTGDAGAAYRCPPAGVWAPVTGNGAILLADLAGSIVAHSAAAHVAAYFDGCRAHLAVPATEWFDFGRGDFTIEAWFRTSRGGELVSSYPTLAGADTHGFRLNLTPAGEFRVAVVSEAAEVLNVGQTAPTAAADGNWHHAAFLRRAGAFVVLLDGQSLTVRRPAQASPLNSLGGHTALTIGAYVARPGGRPEAFFYGLLREVRLWNRALDVATIATNRQVELRGNEPRLRGLWRLDQNLPATNSPSTGPSAEESQPAAASLSLPSAAAGYPALARVMEVASVLTDLALDETAFPYLLHEPAPQWPYAGTWAARGEQPVATMPALSSDGVIAFGTANALYGVRHMDGRRVWAYDLPPGASAPVAEGAQFWVLAGKDSLVVLDAASGTRRLVPGFADLGQSCDWTASGVVAPAPAVSARYLAAGSPDGWVYIASRGLPRAVGEATPVRVRVGDGAVRRLDFLPGAGPGRLLCVAGKPGALQLSILEAATGTELAVVALASAACCLAGPAVVCIQADGIKRLNLVTLRPDEASLAATATIPGAAITGLAAQPDADVLIVTRADGYVHGLSLAKLHERWQQNLAAAGPVPAINPVVVHPPTFDDAGRVVCTSSGGQLVVLDPHTGDLLGLVTMAQPISTPALMARGTAYFGCQAAPTAEATADGALHSLVLGQTLALRLGLDQFGRPAAPFSRYALVTADAADAALPLLDPTASCVEAWVNIPSDAPAGMGGVLGICPSTVAAFDLLLRIDPDGTIHYASRTATDASWTSLRAQVPSPVCDGRWHHVAVVRQQRRLVVYLDGQALPNLTLTTTPCPAPPRTLPGLRAYLGATFDDDLAAAQPFCGLLGEVRVWDTYLTATELAARMHVKLRGDEADLLAYWNFDHAGVHDAARRGHNGVLVPTAGPPAWWLTDLAFTLPSYPHLATQARLVQAPPASPTAPATVYDLTIQVLKADSSGLGGQDLALWYVRHDESEPLTITLNGQLLTGVGPAEVPDDPRHCYQAVSRPDGKLSVTVGTSLAGHGPSLDVRAGFMAHHERFHVNCLHDNQVLAKPVPPTLTAQTCLIQDYHYAPGNKIDETRDKSTHRVVLLATNADHSPRPGELLTLWASADLHLEVAGQSYTLNADTSRDFLTTAHGELVVVLEAAAFAAPTLYARAGFMHRNDRLAIAPDEDAQFQLATLDEPRLTSPVVVNWVPNCNPPAQTRAPTKAQTFLPADYHSHAADIAQSVRHVMQAVRPVPAYSAAREPTGGGQVGAGLPRALHADMQQPLQPPRAGQATVLRTTAHVLRRPPLNADALRDSLARAGAHGFVLEKTATGLRFEHLLTPAAVVAERGLASPPSVGFFGESLWHTVEHAAEDAYAGARKIVVSVAETAVAVVDAVAEVAVDVVDAVAEAAVAAANTIAIAIHKLDGELTHIVHLVVESIDQAVAAVAGFFQQLALDLQQLLAFLRTLFNWDAIVAAANSVQHLLTAMGDRLAGHDFITGIGQAVSDSFAHLATQVTTALGNPVAEHLAGATPASYQPTIPTTAQAGANGVAAKMLFHKLQDHLGGVAGAALAGGGSPFDVPPQINKILTDVEQGIQPLIADLATMNFQDLTTNLGKLASMLVGDSLDFVRDTSIGFLQTLFNSFAEVFRNLVADALDIPFLGALYKWITDCDLTLSSVGCMLLGLPMHIVYTAVGRHFTDVAPGWVKRLSGGSALTHVGNANDPDSLDLEMAYIVFKSLNVLTTALTDTTFSRLGDSPARSLGKVVRGLSGIASTAFDFFFTAEQYNQLLAEAMRQQKETPPKVSAAAHYGAFAVAALADGITLLGGISKPAVRLYSGAPALLASPKEPAFVDKAELFITYCNALFSTVLIIGQIEDFGREPACVDGYGDDQVRMASRLLGGRRICYLTPKLLGWLFTQTAAGDLLEKTPYLKYAVTGIRAAASTAGLAVHCTAAFHYLRNQWENVSLPTPSPIRH